MTLQVHNFQYFDKPTNNRKRTIGRTKKFKIMHAPSFNVKNLMVEVDFYCLGKSTKRLAELSGISYHDCETTIKKLNAAKMFQNFSPAMFRKMHVYIKRGETRDNVSVRIHND